MRAFKKLIIILLVSKAIFLTFLYIVLFGNSERLSLHKNIYVPEVRGFSHAMASELESLENLVKDLTKKIDIDLYLRSRVKDPQATLIDKLPSEIKNFALLDEDSAILYRFHRLKHLPPKKQRGGFFYDPKGGTILFSSPFSTRSSFTGVMLIEFNTASLVERISKRAILEKTISSDKNYGWKFTEEGTLLFFDKNDFNEKGTENLSDSFLAMLDERAITSSKEVSECYFVREKRMFLGFQAPPYLWKLGVLYPERSTIGIPKLSFVILTVLLLNIGALWYIIFRAMSKQAEDSDMSFVGVAPSPLKKVSEGGGYVSRAATVKFNYLDSSDTEIPEKSIENISKVIKKVRPENVAPSRNVQKVKVEVPNASPTLTAVMKPTVQKVNVVEAKPPVKSSPVEEDSIYDFEWKPPTSAQPRKIEEEGEIAEIFDEESQVEIPEEFYQKSKNINNELTSLVEDLNETKNTLAKDDFVNLSKKLRSQLGKLSKDEDNILLLESMLRDYDVKKMIILVKKNNLFKPIQYKNVSRETVVAFSLKNDHRLVRDYLSKNKTIIFEETAMRSKFFKETFSEEDRKEMGMFALIPSPDLEFVAGIGCVTRK